MRHIAPEILLAIEVWLVTTLAGFVLLFVLLRLLA